MNITVRIQSNYGREVVYPVCDAARSFAMIAGTKILTTQSIKLIKLMGYQINVEQVTI